MLWWLLNPRTTVLVPKGIISLYLKIQKRIGDHSVVRRVALAWLIKSGLHLKMPASLLQPLPFALLLFVGNSGKLGATTTNLVQSLSSQV